MVGYGVRAAAPALGLRTELMVLTVAEVIALSFYGGWLSALGTAAVVAIDHGPLLRSIGYRPLRFVCDVLADFAPWRDPYCTEDATHALRSYAWA